MEDLCLIKQSTSLPIEQQPQQLFLTLSLLSNQLFQLEQDLEFCRNLLVTLQGVKPYKLKRLPSVSRKGDFHLYELIELINTLRHSHIEAKNTLDSKLQLLNSNREAPSLFPTNVRVQGASVSAHAPSAQAEFYVQVGHALNHYHLSDTLQSNPLLSCKLARQYRQQQHCDVLSALRYVVRIKVVHMRQCHPVWSSLLQAAYINERANRQQLADRFHMASSTLRRHLKLAREQLAAELWYEEQHLQGRYHTE
jgi:hypothetical protein